MKVKFQHTKTQAEIEVSVNEKQQGWSIRARQLLREILPASTPNHQIEKFVRIEPINPSNI